MPINFIQIIREFTDSVEMPSVSSQRFCCSGMEKTGVARWEPNTDIIESEHKVNLRFELAGVDHEDLYVKLRNGELVVYGIRKEKRPNGEINFHQLGIAYGPFIKIISIPESIEHNEINATYNNGILDVTLSKKSKVVEIPIQIEIE
jgi:HSP20 family protein